MQNYLSELFIYDFAAQFRGINWGPNCLTEVGGRNSLEAFLENLHHNGLAYVPSLLKTYMLDQKQPWDNEIASILSKWLPDELIAKVFSMGGLMTRAEFMDRPRQLAKHFCKDSRAKCRCWLEYEHRIQLSSGKAQFVATHLGYDFSLTFNETREYIDHLFHTMCDDCVMAIIDGDLNPWDIWLNALYNDSFWVNHDEVLELCRQDEELESHIRYDLQREYFRQ